MGEAARLIEEEERLDERIVPRASVQIAIDLYSEHNFWSGITMNVSEGGVFVATQKMMATGTLLIVDMALPGEDEPIIALAEVRWTRSFSSDPDIPAGLGLKFVHLEGESLDKIRRFAERVREPIFFEV